MHVHAGFRHSVLCLLITTSAASVSLAAAPTVVSSEPAHGSVDVDPGLRTIQVTFDQDMTTGQAYSWCYGGDTAPATRGQPRWIDKRTCVLPVRLRPGRTYDVIVNCAASSLGFRSADGQPAEQYHIRFYTAGEAEPVLSPAERKQVARDAIATLREAIEEHYSYRDLRDVNWRQQFAKFTHRLARAETPKDFAKMATLLLRPADDVHLWLTVGDEVFGTHERQVRANIHPRGLTKTLKNAAQLNDSVLKAHFPEGNIGYLAINTWSADKLDELRAIVKVLEEFKAQDVAGLIIDVRANSGGSEPIAQKVAGAFLDQKAVYAKNRYVDPEAADGFGPMFERVVEPNPAGPQLRCPIAVLIGPNCMSATESFVMMMQQVPHATLVGETTYGSSGNPKPFDLGNGVTLYVPSWQDFDPEGNLIEGRGIAPDVVVKAEPADFRQGDPVLEKALEVLRRKSK